MPSTLDTILRRFDSPDEVREFEKGRLELVRIAGQTLGRATYQPGWQWSVHVGPRVNARRCSVEHLGIVLAVIALRETECLCPGGHRLSSTTLAPAGESPAA
jgi:hypothetical protein